MEFKIFSARYDTKEEILEAYPLIKEFKYDDSKEDLTVKLKTLEELSLFESKLGDEFFYSGLIFSKEDDDYHNLFIYDGWIE